MAPIEMEYKKLAVSIQSGQLPGSGCIFQPANQAYSYIFTAAHCLQQTGNAFDISNLLITDHEVGEPIIVRDVHFHPELDIAIILIDRISGIPVSTVYSLEKDTKVAVYGYPTKLRNKEERRENIQCSVSFRHNQYFELSAESLQFTFNSTVQENMNGLSGSGVFFERDGQVFFAGIFTRLKGEDGAYNKLCAFDYTAFEEIVKLNNLCHLNECDVSQMIKDRELRRKVFYVSFIKDCEPYYLHREPDRLFANYLESSRHVWVSGDSGVGKTNLVKRNFLLDGKHFVSIDLMGLEPEECFRHINDVIVDKFNVKDAGQSDMKQRIATNIINASASLGDVLLFVDEVPILEPEKFKMFLTGFITIAEKVAHSCPSGAKWVICTRINPKMHLTKDEQELANEDKGMKNFNFLDMETWREDELNQLLAILKQTLHFSLTHLVAQKIIKCANGLPGRLKNFFEQFILQGGTIDEAIKRFQ